MKVTYSSNNSCGRWWLTDENWRALGAAGWRVKWARDEHAKLAAEPEDTGNRLRDSGRRLSLSMMKPDADGAIRYMGALATEASLECETPADAMRSFEAATGQSATDEGCNCCGEPHRFSWGGEGTGIAWGRASGSECLPHLFPGREIPKSLREAMERK